MESSGDEGEEGHMSDADSAIFQDYSSEEEEEEEGSEAEEENDDTTAEQYRKGKDIQGIPWDQIGNTRERYRARRLEQYRDYTNLQVCYDQLEKESQKVEKGARYYDFQLNTRRGKCTIAHFQLRNLVWATTKHDIYVMNTGSVVHWSPIHRTATEVLNLRTSGQARMQVSTMAVHKDLMVIGGFNGELVAKSLDSPDLAFTGRIAEDENAITNAIEISEDSSGTTRVLTSNNDSIVRSFDSNNFTCTSTFTFPWAVNYSSASPDRKLLCVVGDSKDGLLADSTSGQTIASLKGHLDFSFAAAWHPNGTLFATGNQDATTRLWDMRMLKEALTVLKGQMGAARSLRFSNDGRFLAMAEAVDFIHIFDLNQKCQQCQVIDLFGEVAGMSFSPDGEAFYIGTEENTYGSLLEFKRYNPGRYTNCLI